MTHETEQPTDTPTEPHTRRHLRTAPEHRHEMILRFTIWDQVTGTVGLPAAA
ncbi:hypothetical protein [Embleya sp. NPDC005575]|uniref:hypothetical protein n=1 Tax=Embleya sp. NPDC005575 TaxID=3156892 RepID=UPI0033BABC10